MENDLISRSALKSFLCKCCNVLHSDEACEPSDCNVMGWVDELPTVDAVEVGSCDGCYWKAVNRYHKCSCCKRNRYLKDCYEADVEV